LSPGAKPVSSPQLNELLGKALLDEQLRDRLFTDLETVAREFNLTGPEAEAIKRLDRQKLAEAIDRLRWG
jgi:hypothetical protein